MTVPTYNATGGSNAWASPRAFVAAQARRLGFESFALDCAADRRTRVCTSYIGPDHILANRRDAVACPWRASGPRWLNPPYSRQCLTCPDGVWKSAGYKPADRCATKKHTSRTITDWMAKAAHEGRMGEHPLCVFIPARVGEGWFHRHVMGKAARVFFVSGRVSFEIVSDAGELVAGGPAPFPNLLIDYVPGWRGPTLFGTMSRKGEVLIPATGVVP